MPRRLVIAVLRFLLSPLPSPKDPAHQGPGIHLHWRLGWLKGLLLRAWLAVRAMLGGTRFRAGRLLSVQGRLRVRGPGSVIIGDDVVIADATDIYTHSRDAVVMIGDRTFLNGTRFGCAHSIVIGAACIVADVRIMDTDFHAVGRDRRMRRDAVRTRAVVVEDNVWIAGGSAVLKGVRVGRDSVVAFGSIVTKDVAPGVVVGGNPSAQLMELPDPDSPVLQASTVRTLVGAQGMARAAK